MNALDTLLATQQGPNILGAFNQGIQNRQSQQANALNLQQGQAQQAQQPQRNRLLGAQVQQAEQGAAAGDEAARIATIVKTAAFIGSVTDQAEFEALIDQAPFLDAEAKANAKKFSADGLRRIADQLNGRGRKRVQSSTILDDGTVQLVFSDGSTEIKQAGEAGQEAIRTAKERGVELQGSRSQARQIGSDSAKTSKSAFDQVSKIRLNISNLQDVIRAVGDGANTGPLDKALPSFKSESIRLDNIRNRLGLDVISGVTFGALSEGELKLALDTALPTGLKGPELVQWAKEKIGAQQKLASYFEEQAQFLGASGNTIAEFIDFKKSQQSDQGGNVDDLTAEEQAELNQLRALKAQQNGR